jgi:hypothetical protein
MNNFLNYQNTTINNGNYLGTISTKDEAVCNEICNNSVNCTGYNISNPICNETNRVLGCIEQIAKTNNFFEKTLDSNPFDYKCDLLNNLNKNFYNYDNSKEISLMKQEYVNKIYQLNETNPYLLNINNNYLLSDNINNQDNIIGSSNINEADEFYFKKNSIIHSPSEKCIELNGEYLKLNDCDHNNFNQNLILENQFNSIRSLNNHNLCLTNDNNKIIMSECINNSNNNQQDVILKDNINLQTKYNSLNNITEPFGIPCCNDPYYTIIVNIIILIIIILLVWFLIIKNSNVSLKN